MHLKNQRPIFVPARFEREIERLSKAALMDLVWDFALCNTGAENHDDAMTELRQRIDCILEHRRSAKAEERET